MILMAYRIKEHLYNAQLTQEENVLLDHLYKLRMSGMAEALEKQLMNPNTNLESFETRITDIIEAEWNQRNEKKFKGILKDTTLKYPTADFDEALYEPDRKIDTHTIELLAKGDWLKGSKNLLITGAAGAGKTHVANALCIAALHQLYTVKYIRASVLINEARAAYANDEPQKYINKMADYDLLAIDDFGLMDLDINHGRLLFEILESRDNRKPTMIISQLPVNKWWDLFADNTYADAVLSRATGRAFRLHFPGRDMRHSSSSQGKK